MGLVYSKDEDILKVGPKSAGEMLESMPGTHRSF